MNLKKPKKEETGKKIEEISEKDWKMLAVNDNARNIVNRAIKEINSLNTPKGTE